MASVHIAGRCCIHVVRRSIYSCAPGIMFIPIMVTQSTINVMNKTNCTCTTVEVPERSDGRVDWSSTYAGIEQPNEAYATVLSKNIAYEQIIKPQKKRINDSQPPRATEGEYEGIIEPPHQYEEMLPRLS